MWPSKWPCSAPRWTAGSPGVPQNFDCSTNRTSLPAISMLRRSPLIACHRDRARIWPPWYMNIEPSAPIFSTAGSAVSRHPLRGRLNASPIRPSG